MTLAFQIDDMTCGHCVSRVTAAVKALDPDARITIDLASHSARVDGDVQADAVARAIRDAGYTPVPLPA